MAARRPTSDQLIRWPDKQVVRRRRRLAHRGAPALAVLPGCADPFGPKAVRASAGNVFRLRVAAARWGDLKGLQGYGAASSGGAPLAEAPIESAGMIVFGSEPHGLSRADLEL